MPPVLTRQRVWTAYGVAIAVDVLQFALGPIGWAFADEILDVAAAMILWRVLGFHPLLLPTFVLEFLPVTDLAPMWTACVAIVIALRRKGRNTPPAPPMPGPVIDV
jgi:hypothetical protein